MNAIAMWRCSACGIGKQDGDVCGACETPRDENRLANYGTVHNIRENNGNVYHIHAPTQFNTTVAEPEPIPEVFQVVEEPGSGFQWGTALCSFFVAIFVTSAIVIGAIAYIQPEKTPYHYEK
jgi:hypothetical protein